MYIAHYDHKKQHKSNSLKDHVNEMLMIIQKFNLNIDLYGIIKDSIILHDVGKKSNAFQQYIKKKDQLRGTVQHAIGGAYVLNQFNDKLDQKQRYISNIIQLIVASHHV